jgi:lipopolysaccharide export system permease protein
VHRRYALSATCLLFLILGAPTGLILRRGTQLGALAAGVGYALLYYLLSMRFGKTLGESGTIPEWVAAWSTTVLGALAGLFLLARAVVR